MSLLVCTAKHLLLVKSGQSRALLTGRGIYAGLTWDRNHFYVSERAHTGAEACPDESIGVYEPRNGDLLNRGRIGLGDLHDVHDLFWRLSDEVLYAMESGTNCIRMWGTQARPNQRYLARVNWGAVTGSPADEWLADINHINSFWAKDGKFWVVEHNRGESRVVILSESLKMLDAINLGVEAHNVVVRNNHMFICSSRENRVLAYDLIRHKQVAHRQFRPGFYPRGLALTGDSIWVGLTYFNVERGVRNDGPARILRMDNELRTQEIIDLEDCGQIICLRLLSDKDLAHNRVTPPEGVDNGIAKDLAQTDPER